MRRIRAKPRRRDGLLEEHDVIYIYPMEVTEYYVIVPSESSEMPG